LSKIRLPKVRAILDPFYQTLARIMGTYTGQADG